MLGISLSSQRRVKELASWTATLWLRLNHLCSWSKAFSLPDRWNNLCLTYVKLLGKDSNLVAGMNGILFICLFTYLFICSLIFVSNGVWTQVPAKQVLYYLRCGSSQFCCGYFGDRVLPLAGFSVDHTQSSYFMLPAIAGITVTYHYTQLLVEMGSCEQFAWIGLKQKSLQSPKPTKQLLLQA
jgi:hypothetical protein